MADPLKASLMVSSSGLAAQSQRMRIVSENIANASTTGSTPGADPYSRKTISFTAELERASGAHTVKIAKVGVDRSPFDLVHDPGHAAADANGMVKMPNVELLMEVADMRETIRSYEANIQAARQARELISLTIDLMRN